MDFGAKLRIRNELSKQIEDKTTCTQSNMLFVASIKGCLVAVQLHLHLYHRLIDFVSLGSSLANLDKADDNRHHNSHYDTHPWKTMHETINGTARISHYHKSKSKNAHHGI